MRQNAAQALGTKQVTRLPCTIDSLYFHVYYQSVIHARLGIIS